MNIRRTYYYILLLFFISMACDPNSDNETLGEISIDPAVLTFGSSGGELSAVISSNGAWELRDDAIQYWYEISPTNGVSGETITIKIVSNVYSVARTTTIDFYCQDAVAELILMQYAATTSTDEDEEEEGEEGEEEEQGQSDSESAPDDSDELDEQDTTDSDSQDKDDQTLDLDIETNIDPDPEKPDVDEPNDEDSSDAGDDDLLLDDTPTTDDAPEQDDTDTEVQEPDEDSEDPLSAYRLEFSAEGGSATISLTTTAEWLITLPISQSWVSASLLSGVGDAKVSISVTPNTTGSSRESGFRVAIESESLYVTVYQEG